MLDDLGNEYNVFRNKSLGIRLLFNFYQFPVLIKRLSIPIRVPGNCIVVQHGNIETLSVDIICYVVRTKVHRCCYSTSLVVETPQCGIRLLLFY